MGEEIGPRVNSWDMQMARAQSGTSSFDEQLWEELEAHARRRRSQEGTFGYPGDPQCAPALVASPFARQLTMQGTPTLFGQREQPGLPVRPSLPARSGRPATPAPEGMASPFAAAAQSRGAVPAQQALISQAADASASERPPGPQAKPVTKHSAGALPESALKLLHNGHSSSPEQLHTPANKERPFPCRSSSVGASPSTEAGEHGASSPEPLQEAMDLDELALLNKRAKRRPVQQHKLAEMLAALDAKESSHHGSSAGSAHSKDGGSTAAVNDAIAMAFRKSVSEDCGRDGPGMSVLMDVKSVSQSVPELPPRSGVCSFLAR